MSTTKLDHPVYLARLRRGASVADFAAAAKVSERTINNVESGRRPNMDTLLKLAAATGDGVEQLSRNIAAWERVNRREHA